MGGSDRPRHEAGALRQDIRRQAPCRDEERGTSLRAVRTAGPAACLSPGTCIESGVLLINIRLHPSQVCLRTRDIRGRAAHVLPQGSGADWPCRLLTVLHRIFEQRGRIRATKCRIRTWRKAVYQFRADLSCSRRHDHGRTGRLCRSCVRRVFRLPLLHREKTHRARSHARPRHLRHEQRGQPEEVPGLHPGAQEDRPVPGQRQGGKGHLRGDHQGRA